jgi:hypothetical protein
MRARNAAGVTAILLVAAGVFAAGQARPDVAGAWSLNEEMTARARAQQVDAEPGIGRRIPIGGSGGPVGGGRGPVDVSSGGGRRNAEEASKAREGMRLAALVPPKLTIVRDGASWIVSDGAGVSLRLTPGKTEKTEMGALTVETKARWDGPTLVVERKFEGGVKTKEHYTVSADPRRLVIVSKIESSSVPGDRPRTLHRVYDAAR